MYEFAKFSRSNMMITVLFAPCCFLSVIASGKSIKVGLPTIAGFEVSINCPIDEIFLITLVNVTVETLNLASNRMIIWTGANSWWFDQMH